MNHKVSNRSIEDLNIDDFLGGERIKVIYTDPPWNNFKYWSTLALKQTGEKLKPIDNDITAKFLNTLALNYLDGFMFLEMGTKTNVEPILQGLHNRLEFDVFYKGGGKWLPSKIYVGSTSPDYIFKKDLTGIKCSGSTLPITCLQEVQKTSFEDSQRTSYGVGQRTSFEGGLVFDPFCGLGNTAEGAKKTGMVFYGNEFNKKRYETTLRRIND
tara:strand:+ start:176 stop:814 length:639 start_codon:yes stop_codon:yes gene_type:complete